MVFLFVYQTKEKKGFVLTIKLLFRDSDWGVRVKVLYPVWIQLNIDPWFDIQIQVRRSSERVRQLSEVRTAEEEPGQSADADISL